MYGEEEEWKAVIQMTDVCGDEVRSDREVCEGVAGHA